MFSLCNMHSHTCAHKHIHTVMHRKDSNQKIETPSLGLWPYSSNLWLLCFMELSSEMRPRCEVRRSGFEFSHAASWLVVLGKSLALCGPQLRDHPVKWLSQDLAHSRWAITGNGSWEAWPGGGLDMYREKDQVWGEHGQKWQRPQQMGHERWFEGWLGCFQTDWNPQIDALPSLNSVRHSAFGPAFPIPPSVSEPHIPRLRIHF